MGDTESFDLELNEACNKNVEAVKDLIKEKVDVSKFKSSDMRDYYQTLNFLIDNMKHKGHDYLFTIISNSSNMKDYREALTYCLSSDPTLTKTLIEEGVCLNGNKKCTIAFDKIPSNTLENIFDESIKESSTDRKSVDYALEMDFSLFYGNNGLPNKIDTDLILSLKNSQAHNHLLYHPLPALFLNINWQKTKYLWYIDFFFNILFNLLICLYIVTRYWLCDIVQVNCFYILCTIMYAILTMGSIVMLREVMQFSLLKWDYVTSFDNLLELSILGLTFTLFCIEDFSRTLLCIEDSSRKMLCNEDFDYHRSISAWLIVFITVGLFLKVEKMHLLKVSLYISMFRKVAYNYVKLIILIGSMVLAFALSFNLLIYKKIDDTTQGNNNKIYCKSSY